MSETKKVYSDAPLEVTMVDIRKELATIGVDGMSVDIRYDINSGRAMVNFNWQGKQYSRVSEKQNSVAKNLRAIYINLKHKIIDHARGIEPFGDSMYKYVQLPGQVDTNAKTTAQQAQQLSPEIVGAYAEFGISPYESWDVCEKVYKNLLKTWHPDMYPADPNMHKMATEKSSKINGAWAIIKKHRGKD